MNSVFLKIKTFLKKYGWKALAIWIVWNIIKFTVIVKLVDAFWPE